MSINPSHNPSTLQAIIREQGIEPILGSCLEHAAAMTKMYSGLDDTEKYHYWVKIWWVMQCACDGAETDDLLDAALLEWDYRQGRRVFW